LDKFTTLNFNAPAMDLTIPPSASSHPGTLHFIPPNLCAFEPTKSLAKSGNINTLLWIGGMFDTLLSVTYPLRLAEALGPAWSVVTASLFSVGMGWGVSTISRDADEMAKIIAYLKEQRPGGKLVIMGHSTGCQDCMEYLVGKNSDKRPSVDGVILQAPVSDREALGHILPEAHLHEANQLALKWCRERHDRDVLPNRLTKPAFGRIGITARRWVDIASPAPNHDGSDDYFSSDLPDERLKGTFGKLPPNAPLLALYSGNDDGVPKDVDKRRLVQKWMHITEANGGSVDGINGGVVEGASHNLNGQTVEVDDLVKRVSGFVERLEKGEIGASAGSSRI
jgi:pimeloyl-ACP methyl ester carboxylesterase